VIRFPYLRDITLALATITAAGSLAGCRSEPPQIILHNEKEAIGPGQMVVTGSATLQVSPDCADLTMTLIGEASRPGAAVDKARARQDAMITALRKLGIEDADLKLSTMSVSPSYEWIKDRNVLKGYIARITVTATTKRFEKLGPMMEAGADAGVTEMVSQFRRSDLDELKKKVREQALLAAKAKAQQSATTLELDLGRVSGVSEGSQSYMYSNMYFPRVANSVDTLNDTVAAVLGGELQPLTLEVTVTYDLARSA
jgi:uncharacterized protein YggE